MAAVVVIDAPHFYAALIVTDGVVTEAAPILRWMLGWNRREVWRKLQLKGWRVAAVMAHGQRTP